MFNTTIINTVMHNPKQLHYVYTGPEIYNSRTAQ